MKTAPDIDAYIATYPKDVQIILQKIRETVQKAAPKAGEAIKYGMPTFTYHGNMISFGAYKSHIGFYPAPNGVKEFEKDLKKYLDSKSTLRFPLDEPIPYTLISKVVKFRAKKMEAAKKK